MARRVLTVGARPHTALTSTTAAATLESVDTSDRIWRAFGDNEVSHSAAHYLLAIATLHEAGGAPRAVDVARRLEVSRAAVSLQLRTLKTQGLIEVGDDHRIRLTATAVELVSRIASKRDVVLSFLTDVLGVARATAEADACKIEHLISEETAAALVKLRRFVDADETAHRVVEAFRELTADCAPGARCEFCTRTCLIHSARHAPPAPR